MLCMTGAWGFLRRSVDTGILKNSAQRQKWRPFIEKVVKIHQEALLQGLRYEGNPNLRSQDGLVIVGGKAEEWDIWIADPSKTNSCVLITSNGKWRL